MTSSRPSRAPLAPQPREEDEARVRVGAIGVMDDSGCGRRLRGVRGRGFPANHSSAGDGRMKRGTPKPPICEHGEWRLAGSHLLPGSARVARRTGDLTC